MAKELGVPKFDPNTEAFQMRAQWKKVDNCRKLWFERWSWLLEERNLEDANNITVLRQTLGESDAIRQQAAATIHHEMSKLEATQSLKPVPVTSTGFIGWLAKRHACQLEVYTSWLTKIPVKLPDTWDNEDYIGSKN